MEKISKILKYLKYSLFNKVTYSAIFILAEISQIIFTPILTAQSIDEGVERLRNIHSKLHLIHGSFTEEYPEQVMAATFIPEDAKVLELGANVGRNSCVIASLLNDARHLIAVESDTETVKLLEENRDYNHLQFHIEASAVSQVPLIQSGWKTIPSEVDVPGYTRVNTISFNDIQKKYDLKFDTLVIDCEGAFYYILQDDSKLLENIKLVVIENDFDTKEQMQYVQDHFRNNGLQCVFNQPGGAFCCYDNFYQVWKK